MQKSIILKIAIVNTFCEYFSIVFDNNIQQFSDLVILVF